MAKAFAPANISCIFKIHKHKNPRWMGSYGLGFTLDEGVVVEALKSDKIGILFNKKKIEFPTVKKVIDVLAKDRVKIKITSRLPLGCGFGLSGASSLAAAYAINKLFHLGKSKKELAVIAHTAEVENKTGLGDVVNQYYGGFLAKFRPSSCFEVARMPVRDSYVYCRYFSRVSTKSVITDENTVKKINTSASKALKDLKQLVNKNKSVKFKNLIKISKIFAVGSGLLRDKKTIKAIEMIEKNSGNASMIMLGNAVFSDRPFRGALRFRISRRGAYLL